MKKFFAILLAVLMTASLSVVGMAEEGIQTYGGGVYGTTLYAVFEPVVDRYFTNEYGNTQLVNYGVGVPNETEENSVEGMKEWTAPKVEFEISGEEFVKDGFRVSICNDEFSWTYVGNLELSSFSSENGLLKVVKQGEYNEITGSSFYIVKSAAPLSEAGTIEDTIIVKNTKAINKEMNDVADKGDGPFTFKFPVAITVTGDIPTGGGSTGGGSSDDHDTPPATENAANDDKTLDKLAAGESAEVKLTSGSAALATDTMDTLGSHGGKLTVTVDKMTVAIPGGFGKVNEPGRIYYPLDFSDSLANAADLAAAVKGEKAKTEVVKAGGDMVMPTTVTVTLKTKLTGTVNVYYYNDTTRRYTLLASPAAKDGKITFATKQMGTMVLTTGTI